MVWPPSEMGGIYLTLEFMGDALSRWVPNFSFHRITCRACKNTDCWTPPQAFLILQVWSRAQEFIVLTRSQVMLMPLVRKTLWETLFQTHQCDFPLQPLWLIQGPQPVCLWPSPGHTDGAFQPLTYCTSWYSYSKARDFRLIRKAPCSKQCALWVLGQHCCSHCTPRKEASLKTDS